MRRGAEASTEKLAARKPKLSALDMRVPWLIEEAEHADDLQKHLDTIAGAFKSAERAWKFKESALKEKSCKIGRPEIGLRAARAVIGGGNRRIHDFMEGVYICYTSLIRAQRSSYCDWLNSVLGKALARGQYLGGSCVRVGKGGQSLHFGEEDSDEERDGRTAQSEGGDHHDGIVVVTRLVGTS